MYIISIESWMSLLGEEMSVQKEMSFCLLILSMMFIFHTWLCSCFQVEAVVKDGLAIPDGLAVDWVAKNLYFVDSSAKRIFVCRLNGSHLSSLITKDLSYPRGIAVDPRDG